MKVRKPRDEEGKEIVYRIGITVSKSPFKDEQASYVFNLASNRGIEDLYDLLSVIKFKPYWRILNVSLNADSEGGIEE